VIRVGYVPERIKNEFRVNWIMFHWICPECGREIPPKLKECPSCDPQSAPVVHATEAVGKGSLEASTDDPAPVENVAINDAVAPVADSLAPTLKEIAIPAPSANAKPEIQAPISTATTIEPADPVGRPITGRVAEESSPVEPETTRAPVEAAPSPVVVAEASPESAPEKATAVDPSVHSTAAPAQPELVGAGHLVASVESAAGRPELEAAASEPPAELVATQQLATPYPATRQPDASAAGSQEPVPGTPGGASEATPEAVLRPPVASLSPMASPNPAYEPLRALAEQIREAQTQAFSFADSPLRSELAQAGQTEPPQGPIAAAPIDAVPENTAQADAAPADATPKQASTEPPPIPAEPVPAAITPAVAVASEPPPSNIGPEDAVTEEIFLPPVLARLAASIGISEPRPPAPAPTSPAPVSNGSASTESGSLGSASPAHDAERDNERDARRSPASTSGPGANGPGTTGPLVSTSEHIESVGLMEAISAIQSNLQVESAHSHIDSQNAHSGQLLLTDARPLALLGNAVISAPPEASPAPLETAVIQASPEPVASTAQTVTQLVPPQRQITGFASPDDSSSGKAPSGSWLQLAPLQHYSAATRAMEPFPFAAKILTPDSGPRMTLPGPTLPPELARFQNANLVTVIGDVPRTGKFRVAGWAVSFLVMAALLIVGVGVVFYFLPVAHSSAETQAPAVEGHGNTSQPAAPAPLPSQPAVHPLAQFVEVTGFRIVVDFNKKSEIHYLVVNHSGADLSDVTVYVTLRTASAKPGQPPLCRFSFRAPNLGPFESKEMTSSIEKLSRAITLPEWQDLRPEVQIAQ
jgi:hypothetical protein